MQYTPTIDTTPVKQPTMSAYFTRAHILLSLFLITISIFPVSAEFGAESCFNTVNTEYNAVAMLDATHVVVAYKDTGGDGYGCAKVGVIDGNSVTWGAENCFNSATTDYISIAALDSTHFVVSYRDRGNSDYGTAIVGEVSGVTISSYGAENGFNSADSQYISVTVLDSTHFVAGYTDGGNSDYGTAIVGEVSGVTISSYGAENVFNGATTYQISISSLDSTHFAAIYRDAGGGNFGCARIGVVSGTAISSYGAENCFNDAITVHISSAGLDSTHFVIGYRDGGNSDYGTAIVGEVSGVTISSYGAENVFNIAYTEKISVSSLDSTHFVVAYQDMGGDGYGCARQGATSGTTISGFDTEQTFNSDVTIYIAVSTLSPTAYIVVYKDDGGDDYGCARVWVTSPPPPPPSYTDHFDTLYAANSSGWDMLGGVTTAYEDTIGANIFWGLFISMPFLAMWIRQRSVAVPSVIFLMAGGLFMLLLPPEFDAPVLMMFSLGVVGILFHVFIKRR